jgi:polysaccharide deacetylase 2 family uncharacterized protein YibQ
MAGKKRVGKKLTAAKRAERFQFRLKWISVLLIVLLVGGIVTVKYFKSSHGRVRLLDTGLHTYYALVSEEIGGELKTALEKFDLRKRIDERAMLSKASGKSIRLLEWTISCDPKTNLVLVNVGLTEAARNAGATVLRSEEMDNGNTLIFHVGSKKYDTHRIKISKNKPKLKARPKQLPRLAIVIDDFGYARGGVAAEMVSMDLPLTIAVLPNLPQSKYIVERARKQGKCTLLHLPMEASVPYPSDLKAITTGMGDEEIVNLVDDYLKSLPGVEGVNNHQGSRATADTRVMELVLNVIEKHDLFFLDSLTSSKSVAYNTARELGLPTAKNSIFLDDNTEDSAVVGERLRKAVDLARRDGTAIAIGHPHRWTLEAIREARGFLDNAGVELVFVSELVN